MKPDRSILLLALLAASVFLLTSAARVPAADKPATPPAPPTPAGETVRGTLVAKGDIWIDIRADGEKDAKRYMLVPAGYRLDAKATQFVKDLQIGSDMQVIWQPRGVARQIHGVSVLGLPGKSGLFTGVVTDKTPPDKVAKTLPYLEVKNDAGETKRFSPHWIGNGVDKEMLAALLARNPGDKVEVRWTEDDHVRSHNFRVLAISPEPLSKPSEEYGTISGTVAQKGKDWITIKPAEGEPQRLSPQRIIGAKDELDKDVLKAIATAKAGDKVEGTWIKDGERRLISLKPVLPAKSSGGR